MNKKIILGTLVTSSLLTAALLTPNTMAATIEGTARNNDGKISIVLPMAEKAGTFRQLTEDELVKFVESKYNKDAVKEVTGVVNGLVGTGSKVVLKSGTELTVVLYGDVNGDGIINTLDTVAVARNNVKKPGYILEGVKADAANLADVNEGVDTVDSVRLARFNVRKAGTVIVDESLYPQEEVNTDDKVQNVIEVLKEVGKNNELFNLGFAGDTVVFGFNDTTKTVGDFTNTGLMEKFLEQLNNPDVEKITVRVEGMEDVELTKNSTIADIKALANTILTTFFSDEKDIKSITVSDLMAVGEEINVDIKLNSSVANANKDVTYKLKFQKSAEGELNEIKEKIDFDSNDIVTDVNLTTNENGDNVVEVSVVKEGNEDKTIKEVFNEMGGKDLLSSIVDSVDLSNIGEVKSVNIKLGDVEETIELKGQYSEMKQKVKEVLNNMFGSKKLSEILAEEDSLEVDVNASEKFLAEYCLESGKFVFDFTTVSKVQ